MSTVVHNFTFSTTNAPPPNDRQIRLDGPQATALNVYVDYNEVGAGADVSTDLMSAHKGDTLKITQVSDTTRTVTYTLKSDPVDRSGYVQFSVATLSSGATIATAQNVSLTLDRADFAGYRCYTIVEEDQQGEFVGAGPDLPTVTAIACAMFTTLQVQSVSTWRAVAVYDPTGKQVAWCGRYSEEA